MKTKLLCFGATIALALSAGMVQADEALATKSGCMACHKVDAKLVGPAYNDVAAKYKDADQATIDRLIKQVKEGKSTDLVWGAIPMPPNPAVSEEDVKTVISWILSLGGEAAAAEAPAAEAPAAEEAPAK